MTGVQTCALPICGEPLGERNAGIHEAFVKAQLNASLFHITKDQMKSMVIAYEPVWAIGTGETASSDQEIGRAHV